MHWPVLVKTCSGAPISTVEQKRVSSPHWALYPAEWTQQTKHSAFSLGFHLHGSSTHCHSSVKKTLFKQGHMMSDRTFVRYASFVLFRRYEFFCLYLSASVHGCMSSSVRVHVAHMPKWQTDKAELSSHQLQVTLEPGGGVCPLTLVPEATAFPARWQNNNLPAVSPSTAPTPLPDLKYTRSAYC